MLNGYMLICETVNKWDKRYRAIKSKHFLGFYGEITDILANMEDIYDFEEIGMYYQLSIYRDEEDEGKENLQKQVISTIYSVLKYDFGDIIGQNDDNYHDMPVIVAYTADELEQELRSRIKPTESMKTFILHRENKLPTTVNKLIYDYVKFSRKKKKKNTK